MRRLLILIINILISLNLIADNNSRKSISTVYKFGIEDYNNKFNIKVCDSKDKCEVKKELFEYQISKSLFDKALEAYISFTLPGKFDTIFYKKKNALIFTPKITSKMKIENYFEFEKGNYEDFEKKVLKYLNEKVAPNLEKIIKSLKNENYSKLNIENKNKLIKKQASKFKLSYEVLHTLVNNKYMFSFHLSKIKKGEVRIKNIVTKKQNYYITSLNTSLDISLTVYKFNESKFNIETIILNEKSFFEEQFSDMFSTSSDSVANNLNTGGLLNFIGGNLRTERYPNKNQIKALITHKLDSLVKESFIAMNIKLKREIDDFKNETKVTEVNPSENSLKIGIGYQEDVRVDGPFFIKNNNDEKIGFFKMKTVGDNCPATIKETDTIGKILDGTVNEYDKAIEHPWSGVFANLNIGYNMANVKLDDKDIGGGNSKFVSLAYYGDLGFILNSSTFSEIWLNVVLGFGIIDNLSRDYSDYESSLEYKFNIELEKKLYLSTTMLYLGLGASLGLGIQGYKKSDDEKLGIMSYIVEPFIKLGYNISPDMELFFKGGFGLNLGESSEKIDGKNTASLSHAPTFTIGFNYHVDFIGIFIPLFAKPTSKLCKKVPIGTVINKTRKMKVYKSEPIKQNFSSEKKVNTVEKKVNTVEEKTKDIKLKKDNNVKKVKKKIKKKKIKKKKISVRTKKKIITRVYSKTWVCGIRNYLLNPINVNFETDKRGKLKNIDIMSNNEKAKKCILKKMKLLRFSRVKNNNLSIDIPFNINEICKKSGKICWKVAKKHEAGKKVTKNIEKANIFYTRSCELGYKRACSKLEEQRLQKELEEKAQKERNTQKLINEAKQEYENEENTSDEYFDTKEKSTLDKENKNKFMVPYSFTDITGSPNILYWNIGAGIKIFKLVPIKNSILEFNAKFYRDITDKFNYLDFELKYKHSLLSNKVFLGFNIPIRKLLTEKYEATLSMLPGALLGLNIYNSKNGFFINLETSTFISLPLDPNGDIDTRVFFKVGLNIVFELF